MIDLPGTIKILGKTWKVISAPSLRGSYGKTRFRECDMEIAEDQCLQQKQDTLLHEVLHACFNDLGLEPKEDTVCALGATLLAVLRENPQLIEYLTQEEV